MRSKLIALMSALALIAAAVDPTDIYVGTGETSPNDPIGLRLGGGEDLVDGPNILMKALSDAFIDDYRKTHPAAFKIAYYASETTENIKSLESDNVDAAFTYSPVAEKIAIQQGIAKNPSYYAFRDHYLFVGPKSNPANLNGNGDILTIFAQFLKAAEAGTTPPTRFLSRFDKSATNIKDSELFVGIGQTPWASPRSPWYQEVISDEGEAISNAICLQDYTLTNKGAYLSLPVAQQDQLVIIKAGTDNANDPLLFPCHLLIGSKTTNGVIAEAFAKWVISASGQAVVRGFKKEGVVLYSPAP